MVDESKEAIESSKAIQEMAKTGGKVVGLVRDFGKFIAKYIDGPVEQGVGIFEDKLHYMRFERQVRYMERVNQLMASLGKDVPTKAIPLKLAVPLFQAASLEDDDYLQDMWARLLVNASISERGMELRRAHIDILERLSHLEVLILEKIYSLPADKIKGSSIITGQLPDAVSVEGKDQEKLVSPNEEVTMALANLDRLGCIKLPTTWDGAEIFTSVCPTVMGESLVKACQF
ncbi:MAG: Abi-alpha family protein [Gammaproteobacteria bacterium]|nr:Abi-alpha family protein [Gammaproteobacteria bacterium]